MLKKIAAGLIAASMLTAPMLVAGPASAATPKATTTKTSVKTVKAHRQHARIVVRHGVRYMKVVRHGKIAWVKVRTAKHSVKHVKKVRPNATKPGAA
jgi:hypothetical protein